MPRWADPLDALLAVRGHLFPWVPVCLAAGIGSYFALPVEPGAGRWGVLAAAFATAALAWARLDERWRPVALAAAAVFAGALVAGARTHWVAAPVLNWRYYGPVEGRVVAIDRSRLRPAAADARPGRARRRGAGRDAGAGARVAARAKLHRRPRPARPSF